MAEARNLPPIAAAIEPVREVSLVGSADLSLWRDVLAKEGFIPSEVDDKASLLVTASDSVFKGMPFRELANSVKVASPNDGLEPEGYFLVHAFNSVRFFAFIERAVFRTPYFHAAVTVDLRLPASMHVERGGEELFRAEMGAAPIKPLRDAPDGFKGPLYLSGGRVFYATLEGRTQTYAFDPAQDVVSVSSSAPEPIFRWLRESGFQGQEWIIREHARHAKSKTVRWSGR